METFMESYTWIALLVVMVVEFLIGNAKIKSNSTIELVMNIIKFIFGLNKESKK